jgi:CMP-N-acetylneuraminic acid synthetase
VPGKNYRLFGGEPLFHHVVRTLLEATQIERVVIDTDSPTIREDAAAAFPEVVVIERPEHLRDGRIAMNDVLLNDLAQLDGDWFLQTHSTNPLLRAATVDRAEGAFLDSLPGHDSLFSVTRLQTRLWTADGAPLNHDPAVLLRTQDLPPIYEENSCLYLFSRDGLTERGSRIGQRPMLFEIDAKEAVDIDEEIDFQVAEALFTMSAAR